MTKWRMMAAMLMVAAILLTTVGAPALAQAPITRIRSAVIGTLSVTGVSTVTNEVWRTSTTATITNNATLTPAGTFQPITAAAAVGTSGANITVGSTGTVLVLLNVGSNTITFTETGTLVSAGNIALGANDSATLISNGTNWYQVGASNN